MKEEFIEELRKHPIKTVANQIIKRLWYIIILIISTIYVFVHRYDVYDMKSLNAVNLIFAVWLILVIFPIFSEIEVFGVKIKKQVEEVKKDVDKSISRIEQRISNMSVSNSFEFNLLPSKQEIEGTRTEIKKTSTGKKIVKTNVPDQAKRLFEIRYTIENLLKMLCMYSASEIKYSSIINMARELNLREVINGRTTDAIIQISRIASGGIHGEIISKEYIDFVNEIYPEIVEDLKKVETEFKEFKCPKCGYSGYSRYIDLCPKCGRI